MHSIRLFRPTLCAVVLLGGAMLRAGDAPATPATGRPALVPGVWTEITPPGLPLKDPGNKAMSFSYGCDNVILDPSDPATLYACIDRLGLWKSTDAGGTWKKLGDPEKMGVDQTSYLDSPIAVRVDPADRKHLYATQGVRGKTQGFWISTDGGETWARPQGFIDIIKSTTKDVTTLAVDPTDFKHVLVGSHSAWPGRKNAGFIETTDGGATWVAHAPVETWDNGSIGIHFLFAPDKKIGDNKTWLVVANGVWRTTTGGEPKGDAPAWTKVSDAKLTHHGCEIYYAKNGALYAGVAGFPIRSMDNGQTWTLLDNHGLKKATYYTVHGDGTTLYTQIAFTGTNNMKTAERYVVEPQPYMVSPEEDGLHWTPYRDGAQTFINGPFALRFDAVNRILYSANWNAGVWALKVEGK